MNMIEEIKNIILKSKKEILQLNYNYAVEYEKLYYYKIMKALINDKIVEIGNREMAQW